MWVRTLRSVEGLTRAPSLRLLSLFQCPRIVTSALERDGLSIRVA